MDVRFGDDEAGLLTVSSIAVVVDVSEVTVRNNKEVAKKPGERGVANAFDVHAVGDSWRADGGSHVLRENVDLTLTTDGVVNELDVGSGDGGLAVVFEGGVVRNREQIVDVCDTHAASLEGESKEGA